MLKKLPLTAWIFIGIALGLASGLTGNPMLFVGASAISDLFLNLFKAISLPVIFLSLVSAISGLSGTHQVRNMGGRVFFLALLTTFTSSCVAFLAYLSCRPFLHFTRQEGEAIPFTSGSYLENLKKIVPDNFLKPFLEGHAMGVLFIALIVGVAALQLETEHRQTIHRFFSSFAALFMKIVGGITLVLPIGVWAFACLFVRDLQNETSIKQLGFYLLTIVAANLVQAFVVLPLFLKRAGIPVWTSFKGMWPALSLAFFTKSSFAAMPLAIRCAEENLSVSPQVSRFSFPLCTSVNMNACAGFILITFLFVGESNGVIFSIGDLLQWVFLSTVVAMGHAGVPMGCFFLASALVAQANFPLTLMGMILPFYTVLDMLESAINLWSDSCVTLSVNKNSQTTLT